MVTGSPSLLLVEAQHYRSSFEHAAEEEEQQQEQDQEDDGSTCPATPQLVEDDGQEDRQQLQTAVLKTST